MHQWLLLTHVESSHIQRSSHQQGQDLTDQADPEQPPRKMNECALRFEQSASYGSKQILDIMVAAVTGKRVHSQWGEESADPLEGVMSHLGAVAMAWKKAGRRPCKHIWACRPVGMWVCEYAGMWVCEYAGM